VPALGSNGAAIEDGGAPRQAPAPQADTRAAGLKSRRGLWFALVATVGLIAVAGCLWLLVRPLPPPTVSNLQQLTNDGLPKGYLATDGERLYFTERASAREFVLKQMSVNGGEPSTIPAPPGDLSFLDVSPDHASLLLSASEAERGPIWLLSLPSGSTRQIGKLLGREASWSPDARKIAYCRGHELWVANKDGSEPRKIATAEAEVLWPHWSPDGSRLTFTVGTSTAHLVVMSLWEISPDGAGLHRVLGGRNEPPAEGRGSWTPDGRYFVFESDNDGRGSVWAIREKGWRFDLRRRAPVQLTEWSRSSYCPLPSSEGKRVFFLARAERGSLEHFSKVEREFVPFLGGFSAKWVTYSQDGNWIAYVKYPEDTLWRMRRDGTDPLQLTFSPMRLNGVAWSPDGKQIAINAWTAASRFKNYLVDAKGRDEPKELRSGHNEMEGLPSWPEDGRKIAFGDVPEVFGNGTKKNVIHILDLSTGKTEVLPGSEGFWSSRWSPDGRYIAALKDDDPYPFRQPLFLFDCKTRDWLDLHVNHVRHMLWSHDAKYVYYDDEMEQGIFRIRVPNGRPEPVADTNEILRVADNWFGLAPDDSPLILRDAGSEEIYSLDVKWP
jgi:Tol biopolymer transport system component